MASTLVGAEGEAQDTGKTGIGEIGGRPIGVSRPRPRPFAASTMRTIVAVIWSATSSEARRKSTCSRPISAIRLRTVIEGFSSQSAWASSAAVIPAPAGSTWRRSRENSLLVLSSSIVTVTPGSRSSFAFAAFQPRHAFGTDRAMIETSPTAPARQWSRSRLPCRSSSAARSPCPAGSRRARGRGDRPPSPP